MQELQMPALADEQQDALVVRWIRAEGDHVAAGEPILEVETDKAVVEIEAPATGRLGGIQAVEGDRVPVGHLLATIEES